MSFTDDKTATIIDVMSQSVIVPDADGMRAQLHQPWMRQGPLTYTLLKFYLAYSIQKEMMVLNPKCSSLM